MNPTDLCMGCMQERGGTAECAICGWRDDHTPDSPLYLPQRTVLQDQYLVGRVLGHGGFGITYLGWDLNLALKLAIKEYLPSGVATREPGSTMVKAYAGRTQQDYEWGLEKFLEEARVLARFQNRPGIVSVLNFFRANGSAYLVMECLEGTTLERYLDLEGGRIAPEHALRIMTPVMNALREVHQAGILHRDISPDNIHISRSGQVKVLDFGAARYALGQQSKNLSVILKEGYAPEEQYRTKGSQGPWTDVYATAATLYRAITGVIPTPALDRLEADDLAPPSSLPGIAISSQLESCLLKALAVKGSERYQSMEDFQAALSGMPVNGVGAERFQETKTRILPVEPEPVPAEPQPQPQPVPAPKRNALPWAVGAVAVVALAGGLFVATRRATPPPAAPSARLPVIRTFRAEPDSAPKGSPVTLQWSVEDATEVSIDPGIGKQAASGQAIVSPTAPATYTLTARGTGGAIVTSTVQVAVNDVSPPTAPGRGATVSTSASSTSANAVARSPGSSRRTPPTSPAGETPGKSTQLSAGGEPAATGATPMQPTAGLSWLVDHDHSGFTGAVKGIAGLGSRRRVAEERCTGQLSVEGGHVRFQSATSGDSFDAPLADIQEVRVNRLGIGGRRTFHIKLRSGENYNFVPQGDAAMIVSAIAETMRRGRVP